MARRRNPRAVAQLNIIDLRQEETTPFAAIGQPGSAGARELIGERLLLPLGVPKDDWAEFTVEPFVRADNLFSHAHRLLEQPVF